MIHKETRLTPISWSVEGQWNDLKPFCSVQNGWPNPAAGNRLVHDCSRGKQRRKARQGSIERPLGAMPKATAVLRRFSYLSNPAPYRRESTREAMKLMPTAPVGNKRPPTGLS